LEPEYNQKQSEYISCTQKIADEQIKCDLLTAQYKEAAITLDDFNSSSDSLVQEILFPNLTLRDKLKEALKMISINHDDLMNKLLNFFSIFDLVNFDQEAIR
jgi:hypothetical protein